jgi:DNA polymerase I-like protein with 3'-5' exonuclease and polymerase domains
MKQAVVLLDESLSKFGIDYRFVANVHDEWQIEVEESYADMVGKIGVQSIENAGKLLGDLDKITKLPLGMRCPLGGEYKVGNSWKETH